MKPIKFNEQNRTFGPPEGMTEEQVGTVNAFVGETKSGSCDGVPIIVVAWKPSELEVHDIIKGRPIFLTIIGTGLPPHLLSTNFQHATNPA